MADIKLEAKRRTVLGKQNRRLRREGILPAVVYGSEFGSFPIELDRRSASRLLARVSRSTLIELQVDDQPHTVLVREIQRDPLRGRLLHVDFLRVRMDVRIRAEVPIELVGEAPAAKIAGGVLVTGVDAIEVEALPADLPDRVTVDLESLANIDDSITVADLFVGENVRILTELNELVARVIYEAEEIIPEAVVVTEAVEGVTELAEGAEVAAPEEAGKEEGGGDEEADERR
ncbi:MAG: 50S ribosomal protein L25 [Anaerolineales bacterium]